MSVIPFDDEKDAIRIANDTPFGLAAAVWSRDIFKAFRMVKRLQAGIVWVNHMQPTYVEAPWGGYKMSGIGRELGPWGAEEYLQVKQVHINLNEAPIGMVLRRDFLNGFALGHRGRAGAAVGALGLDDAAPEKAPGYYPPALTGLRGSHDGATRRRTPCATGRSGRPRAPRPGHRRDLRPRGGGRRHQRAGRRVLLPPGGRARRRASWSSTTTTTSAATRGATSSRTAADDPRLRRQLLHRQPRALQRGRAGTGEAARHGRRELAEGRRSQALRRRSACARASSSTRETFGADRLLPMPVYDRDGEAARAPTAPRDAWTSFLAGAPLSEAAKRDLRRLYTESADYLPGLTSDAEEGAAGADELRRLPDRARGRARATC